MIRKINFKVGDLVKHRFINYGLGIVIEKRESISFGEILSSYVVHFPQEDLRRLVFSTEIDDAVSDWGHSSRQ
jgi:RNA polymerase-interacting CarD/CdnL/TRCF family regulator